MTALLLLAAALLVLPARHTGRLRLTRIGLGAARSGGTPDRPPGHWLAPVAGLACGLLTVSAIGGWTGALLAVPAGASVAFGTRLLTRRAGTRTPDPFPLAAGLGLLAACLRAGLPVPSAVRAVAGHFPAESAGELRTVAERMALGSDARLAWDLPDSSPLAKVARAARRSADSGSALADVVTRAAGDIRTQARDVASARGQRAAVLITGPLGVCFLPAFLALGVAPVVIGLASGLARTW